MFTCIVCHFATELDDVVIRGLYGYCLCLCCYVRDTADARRVPGSLERAIVAALAEPEPDTA